MCRGPECGDRRGSKAIYDAFRRAIDEAGLGDRIDLGWQSCFGRCTQGPNVLVREVPDPGSPPGSGYVYATALYNGLDVVHVPKVVQEHLERDVVVLDLVRRPPLVE